MKWWHALRWPLLFAACLMLGLTVWLVDDTDRGKTLAAIGTMTLGAVLIGGFLVHFTRNDDE